MRFATTFFQVNEYESCGHLDNLKLLLAMRTDYLAPMLLPATLNELLESSDVVGNIRFSHPTLYVFPGGQGDAALFGINGFNMLGECLAHAVRCGLHSRVHT